MTLNGLPIYKMTIDEQDDITGVEFISLVDYPAIEVNWVAMSTKSLRLFSADKDKQIVTGPAMIPDLPIYRADAKLGEYYVSFTKEEIEKIARKFNREARTLAINYQHETDSHVESSVILEQWFIQDSSMDKAKALGFDLPVGTWMVTVHFSDRNFWEKEIKSGNVRGFSIEGFLNMQMNKIKESKMEKVKMAEAKTVDGVVVSTPNEGGFEVGAEVFVVDAEGNQTAAPDGEHALENGSIIVVAEGKVAEVKQPEAPVEEAEEALTEEQIEVIENALSKKFSAIEDRIKALEAANEKLSAENKALKDKFSKIPGNAGIQKNDEKPAVKPVRSLQEKLSFLKIKK